MRNFDFQTLLTWRSGEAEAGREDELAAAGSPMHNARLHAARQSLLARRVKYGRLETENVQIPNQMRIELFYLVKYYGSSD